jgi:predicted dehydrogenase
MAHWPALQAVPGVELRGLIASNPRSTAAASEQYGVPGFATVAEMAADDSIDLVAITVKVPEHRRLLEPLLDSPKAVLCEWPLALDLAEAETFRPTAAAGPRFTGLQGHVSPMLRWVRELVQDGYVGRVLSSAMLASFPGGGPTFTPGSAYTADVANGATMVTIPFAHALDMQTVVLGDLTETTTQLATLLPDGIIADTGAVIPKTAPDELAVTGRLSAGGVASMHFRGAAHRTTPFLWEIDGTEGSLRVTGNVGLPMSATLTLEGAQGTDQLAPMTLPDGYDRYPDLLGTPAHNVAHLYDRVATAIGGQDAEVPTFADGLELHRTLEALTNGTEARGHIAPRVVAHRPDALL